MCDLIEDHNMQIPIFRGTSETFKPSTTTQRQLPRSYPGAHGAKSDWVVEPGAGAGSTIGEDLNRTFRGFVRKLPRQASRRY